MLFPLFFLIFYSFAIYAYFMSFELFTSFRNFCAYICKKINPDLTVLWFAMESWLNSFFCLIMIELLISPGIL